VVERISGWYVLIVGLRGDIPARSRSDLGDDFLGGVGYGVRRLEHNSVVAIFDDLLCPASAGSASLLCIAIVMGALLKLK
jgi:hypothetical protein